MEIMPLKCWLLLPILGPLLCFFSHTKKMMERAETLIRQRWRCLLQPRITEKKPKVQAFSSEVNAGKHIVTLPASADKALINTVSEVFKFEIEKNKKAADAVYGCCGQKEVKTNAR